MSTLVGMTFTLNVIIQSFNSNPNPFEGIPEFIWIAPIAEQRRLKGCFCGMNVIMSDANKKFNEIIPNLSEESARIIKERTGYQQLCFAIHTTETFFRKCF